MSRRRPKPEALDYLEHMPEGTAERYPLVEVRGFRGSLRAACAAGLVTGEEIHALLQPNELDRERTRTLALLRRGELLATKDGDLTPAEFAQLRAAHTAARRKHGIEPGAA